MAQNNKKAFIFNFLGNCPNCQKPYQAQKATLISKKGTLAKIYASCSHCKNSSLILVVRNQGTVWAIGLPTDFTKEDAFRFDKKTPITIDEVLEQWIKSKGK